MLRPAITRESILAAFILLVIGLVSCNGGIPSFLGTSPSDVVKNAYAACNRGEYSKAEDLFSSDLKKAIHSDMGVAIGGIKRMCDTNTKGGTLTGVDVKSETIRGEGATVIADLHYKDGRTKQGDKNELIKENGAWKLTTGGN
jgi:hypothetical protein